LQEEAELEEIVRLVGVDALSFKDQLTMETARSIREDYLHQNAFHEIDTYASLKKQHLMLKAILLFDEAARVQMDQGVSLKKILADPIREQLSRVKYIKEDEIEKLEAIVTDLQKQAAVGMEV
jgi:V/A-type H+-transporting ATPase subunit A